ncbi:hypothetical protein HGRIS_002394 [Hohenbuehelia grisea]|uniref:Uncharacterized protein n=1 Tax=Hohenbuehelia grisea TaxID=104357 RepID=A0ABR3JKC5_9AGAR
MLQNANRAPLSLAALVLLTGIAQVDGKGGGGGGKGGGGGGKSSSSSGGKSSKSGGSSGGGGGSRPSPPIVIVGSGSSRKCYDEHNQRIKCPGNNKAAIIAGSVVGGGMAKPIMQIYDVLTPDAAQLYS